MMSFTCLFQKAHSVTFGKFFEQEYDGTIGGTVIQLIDSWMCAHILDCSKEHWVDCTLGLSHFSVKSLSCNS